MELNRGFVNSVAGKLSLTKLSVHFKLQNNSFSFLQEKAQNRVCSNVFCALFLSVGFLNTEVSDIVFPPFDVLLSVITYCSLLSVPIPKTLIN